MFFEEMKCARHVSVYCKCRQAICLVCL